MSDESMDVQHKAAIEAIREFVGAPTLSVAYVETTTDPNNSAVQVEVYDAEGVQFMVDVQRNAVVSMQMDDPGQAPSANAALSPEELEQKAREFLAARNPCFGAAASRLEFTPGNKDGHYFFRWQIPQSDPNRPLDQPAFIQVGMSIDGTIFGYVDAGICGLDLDSLPPLTPTPQPTDTPQAPAPEQVPTTNPPAGYEGWLVYTNAAYGFSVRYPADWTLEEEQDPNSTMQGRQIILRPPQPMVMLVVGFKRADEEAQITRTGVGSGDLVTRGTVTFLGQDVTRHVLVAAGNDMTVLYGEGEIHRSALAFSLSLDYLGQALDASALSEEIQTTADQIVASFQTE